MTSKKSSASKRVTADTTIIYTGLFGGEIKSTPEQRRVEKMRLIKNKYLSIALRPTHKRRVNGEQFEFKK